MYNDFVLQKHAKSNNRRRGSPMLRCHSREGKGGVWIRGFSHLQFCSLVFGLFPVGGKGAMRMLDPLCSVVLILLTAIVLFFITKLAVFLVSTAFCPVCPLSILVPSTSLPLVVAFSPTATSFAILSTALPAASSVKRLPIC